ncbi:hypothetical protein CHELA40_11604 [Chelatococcus asaccharovorans]|nr:hypothetical protein CHELA40_11604 [Chelatococcus asaccharovorans]CAH1684433.1 hypothetical protein CHELA17_63997 [Chelatococcus asaccharovorans]
MRAAGVAIYPLDGAFNVWSYAKAPSARLARDSGLQNRRRIKDLPDADIRHRLPTR